MTDRLRRMTEIEADEVILGRVLYQEASVPAQPRELPGREEGNRERDGGGLHERDHPEQRV
jgi:hypothetical protein